MIVWLGLQWHLVYNGTMNIITTLQTKWCTSVFPGANQLSGAPDKTSGALIKRPSQNIDYTQAHACTTQLLFHEHKHTMWL